MRTCTKCGAAKPLEEFYRDRPNGQRTARCKACARDARAAYRDANRERINREKREDHRRRPHLKWRYRYEERMRDAGMLPLVGEFTRADVVDRYGDACVHCGGAFEELDHYPVTVAQGGPHTLENVRPSCTACNRRSWRGVA